MLINKALLKYGYSGFMLDILEFCDKDEVIVREQYYLDLFKPEYNILKKAGSSLGFTHSFETKAKMREARLNYIVSEETRAKIRANNLNRSEEFKEIERVRLREFNLTTKGVPIEVINVLTNEKTIYLSIRQAASKLGVVHTSIRRVLESKKLLKAIYRISYLSKDK
ncbi:putative intron-encoded endonuclease bI1 [Erysiphe neolycopersici]|uniref:Putative intron-encoded endonuclease bI1 n=1 Tax=Erysiphe neolycopersici TaxID=212602 RepID=A0A420HUQ4_9PEZI|nr:putative intron-encoded endonuclease bI1 [Erysiphe neolycopersici]